MDEELALQALKRFIADRDWGQFHTEENLAKSISVEAAELLEIFQWGNIADPNRVKEEVADVLTYCYLLAMKLGTNPSNLVLEKLQETEIKYPVEEAKGRSTKYDQL
ncbi:MAG: nucleotide pyrophosphohydrolase [Fimbriimonadales bacterium]|nr:nucleotide pyrophosphohydrolase [Fimbriimonadales bacterium]